MRFLPSIALVLFICPIAASAPIQWQEDLRQAHAVAQRENKPLLLHFTTDHCVYCDRLEAGAFKSSDVQSAIERGFVPVKIHAVHQPELTRMFKVSRFPTDVIITTGGDALVHRVSPQEPREYTAMLGASAAKFASNQSSPNVSPATASGMSVDNTKVAQTAATGGSKNFEPPIAPESMMMPPMPSQKVAAKPASSQMSGMMLPPMPNHPTANHPTANHPTANQPMASQTTPRQSQPSPNANRVAASTNPTLALEGYCSVSVVQDAQWVQGSPEFGVVHLGQLYLFTDQNKMETFLANPVPFTPILNGIDVVRFFEERKIVQGKREFSAVDPDHNRVFLFADEEALTHFENTFERYVDSAIAVMDKAVTQSNP